MKRTSQKIFGKIPNGKKMPSPVQRVQNLAARLERPKSRGKNK